MDACLWHRAALVSGCLAIATPCLAVDHRRVGDALENALPASVALIELWRGDGEGALQFGASFVSTMLATRLLKSQVHERRPDGSADDSFPSGHASRAFAAATYLHRRHGWDAAWPWYAAAGYVGWTRVNADRHRWRDVAGSLVIAGASSGWLVEPARERGAVVRPSLAPGRVGIELHARW